MAELRVSLFAPGMTRWHRAGLAGLVVSLKALRPGSLKRIQWETQEDQQLQLQWQGETKTAFAELLQAIYELEDGVVVFPAWTDAMKRSERVYMLQSVLLGTFLQHPLVRTTGKRTIVPVSNDQDEVPTMVSHLPLLDFEHRKRAGDLTKAYEKGSGVPIRGWMLPGGAVRHVTWNETTLEEPVDRALCLLGAPLGCLYFQLRVRNRLNRWSERYQYAVAIPEVRSFQAAEAVYKAYRTFASSRSMTVGPATEASMAVRLVMRTSGFAHFAEEAGIEVVVFGRVAGSQQTIRTLVQIAPPVPAHNLDLFEELLGIQKLEPRRFEANGITLSDASVARGFFADRLALNQKLFRGFGTLMMDERCHSLAWEAGGIAEYLDVLEDWLGKEEEKSAVVDHEGMPIDPIEMRFIRAMQEGIKNRFGKAAKQARDAGSPVPDALNRERERMRIEFGRGRDAKTARAGIIDFLSRNTPNNTLAKEPDHFSQLLFNGRSWADVRDLALLALAGYRRADDEESAEESKDASEGEDVRVWEGNDQ